MRRGDSVVPVFQYLDFLREDLQKRKKLERRRSKRPCGQ